jgi:hypothetical protein
MYYYYHANGLALGGRIRRPTDEVIESQASAVLPSSGGFGSTRVEHFNFKGIVSFRAAHTEVAGSDIENDNEQVIHTARSSVIVEGLNILNVVTADRVIARLASRHPHNDDEPGIITTGSYFENLKIAGHTVDVVEFAHETFHSFDTHKKLNAEFGNNPDKLECLLGRGIEGKGAQLTPHVAHLKEKFEKIKKAGKLPSTVVCSVIKQVSLKPQQKEIQVYGPIVVVPRFGTIILGEVIVKHSSKRLQMLRVELGSPDQGCILCAIGEGNGVGG